MLEGLRSGRRAAIGVSTCSLVVAILVGCLIATPVDASVAIRDIAYNVHYVLHFLWRHFFYHLCSLVFQLFKKALC